MWKKIIKGREGDYIRLKPAIVEVEKKQKDQGGRDKHRQLRAGGCWREQRDKKLVSLIGKVYYEIGCLLWDLDG